MTSEYGVQIRALGCLEIVVDLVVSVFLVFLCFFSLLYGCLFLKCGVVEWFLGFPLRVNPILNVSLMSLLLLYWAM